MQSPKVSSQIAARSNSIKKENSPGKYSAMSSEQKYKLFMSSVKNPEKYEPMPLKDARIGEEKMFKLAKLDP